MAQRNIFVAILFMSIASWASYYMLTRHIYSIVMTRTLNKSTSSTSTPDANGSYDDSSWLSQFEGRLFQTKDLPMVPGISIDQTLVVLSATASHLRYGGCVTFVLVFYEDVPRIMPKEIKTPNVTSANLNLWCTFDDGSLTPAYTADISMPDQRVSLLDCSLSDFARQELWKKNRTLNVVLIKRNVLNQSTPILKAAITPTRQTVHRADPDEQLLTLCTSPLKTTQKYLAQWIEYHRLIGFKKFVIYNTTDTKGDLLSTIKIYSQKEPQLIDVIQWNFAQLRLKDWHSRRYFQVEAVHDCLFRYGDHSDWLGIMDLDEYIVPLPPYKTLEEYLRKNFKRLALGSIIFNSLFFCDEDRQSLKGTKKEPLVTERFIFRAANPVPRGREKYLCRPPYIQNLGIHRQFFGLPPITPSATDLMFAHYVLMSGYRNFPECAKNRTVKDTRIRDLFSQKTRLALSELYTN